MEDEFYSPSRLSQHDLEQEKLEGYNDLLRKEKYGYLGLVRADSTELDKLKAGMLKALKTFTSIPKPRSKINY